jgi:hypothetical protein
MKNKRIKLFESYSNSYQREIPRDFFNEAKLLKCMGVLALKILDDLTPEGIVIEIPETGQPFEIERQEEHDGLCVSNYTVEVNGEEYLVYSKYNSKSNFPLYIVDDEYNEAEVFDEKGNFSEDFIEMFS